MQNAQARLSRRDAGAETRAAQEQVIKELQKLIDAARQNSQNSQSSQQQQQRSGSQQKSSSPQNESQSQGSPAAHDVAGATADRGRGPGGAADRRKRPESAKNPPNVQHPLFCEVWGHLPPALRERVPADFSETILPAYDDVVRRYFEALLDESSSSSAASKGSKQPQ